MHTKGLNVESRGALYERRAALLPSTKHSPSSLVTKNRIIWSAILLAFLFGLLNLISASLRADNSSRTTPPEPETSSFAATTESSEAPEATNLPNSTQQSADETVTTNVETKTSASGTTVEVNNQPVDVPSNGTINKTVVSGNGDTTNISVSNTNTQSVSDDTSSSFTSVQVNSNSTTESNDDFSSP